MRLYILILYCDFHKFRRSKILEEANSQRKLSEFGEEMQFSSAEEEAEARHLAETAARAEALADEKGKATSSSSTLAFRFAEHTGVDTISAATATKFVTREEREKAALRRLEDKRRLSTTKKSEEKLAYERFITGKAEEERRRETRKQREEEEKFKERRSKESNKKSDEADHELKAIREHYLGGVTAKKKVSFILLTK